MLSGRSGCIAFPQAPNASNQYIDGLPRFSLRPFFYIALTFAYIALFRQRNWNSEKSIMYFYIEGSVPLRLSNQVAWNVF